jgi:glycosyltransferase involved in cell wall biosynthesis
MPIEADPLCFSWAMVLMKMDKALIISQFGTEEAIKMGIDAEHIRIGLDTSIWKFRTQEEKMDRGVFGFDNETFVVLTVADNQERKNLARGMEIFAEFSLDKPNTKYVLVTREHNPVGWKLRDLAQEFDITDKLMIFERGIPQEQLWSIFAISDVFLLPSKAEGLGMPMLEAMAVGLPLIATNCTGMKEVITEGGGFPLDYDECCTYRDCFGNGRRRMASQKHGVTLLNDIYGFVKNKNEYLDKITLGAREYVETRMWEESVEHLDNVIKELLGEEEDGES